MQQEGSNEECPGCHSTKGWNLSHFTATVSTKQALLPDSSLRANAGTALPTRGKVGGPVLTRLRVAAAFQAPRQPSEPRYPVEQPQMLLPRYSFFCPNITYSVHGDIFTELLRGAPSVSKGRAEGAQDVSLFLFSR